jgi:hypothetical protein
MILASASTDCGNERRLNAKKRAVTPCEAKYLSIDAETFAMADTANQGVNMQPTSDNFVVNFAAAQLLVEVAILPVEHQPAALLAQLADMLPPLPAEAVRALRREIGEPDEESDPTAQAVCDLLDGHLILREVGIRPRR